MVPTMHRRATHLNHVQECTVANENGEMNSSEEAKDQKSGIEYALHVVVERELVRAPCSSLSALQTHCFPGPGTREENSLCGLGRCAPS